MMNIYIYIDIDKLIDKKREIIFFSLKVVRKKAVKMIYYTNTHIHTSADIYILHKHSCFDA